MQAPVVRFCSVLAVCARGANTSLKANFGRLCSPVSLGRHPQPGGTPTEGLGISLAGRHHAPLKNKINCCAGSGGAYGSALGKGKRTGRFPGAAP